MIDVEGSFHSLREQFDYVLLGAHTDDVDSPMTPENAALLATTLLETRVSAIIDLYEYRLTLLQQIVYAFLDALINAPKELWHDCLVVLDEAHVVAVWHVAVANDGTCQVRYNGLTYRLGSEG